MSGSTRLLLSSVITSTSARQQVHHAETAFARRMTSEVSVSKVIRVVFGITAHSISWTSVHPLSECGHAAGMADQKSSETA
jgi:hypothetical protein